MSPAALRSSGLTVLGDVPWGTHLSIFYETQQDLLDALVPYFRAGLVQHESCFWVVKDRLSVEEAQAALARAVPDFEKHLSAGSVEIVDGEGWYEDLATLTARWGEKLELALAKGAEGLRVSGNPFWIGLDHRDDVLAYEHELDAWLEGRPMLVLCTYPLRATTGADILDVVRAHQVSAVRRNGEWSFVEASGAPIVHSLTMREMEVLSWVARGKSAWEIGKILGITKRTVDEHARSAARKLGAANRAEASALAVQRRIIELD